MGSKQPSSAMGLQIELAAGLDIGREREAQQDALYIPERALTQADYDRGVLLVVADGVGGLRAGNEASYLAVTVVTEVFEQEWAPDIRSTLARAVAKANAAIYRHSREFRRDRMATTIVCGVIQRNLLYLAHLGDSRAYCLRHNSLMRLTKDHSVVQALVDAGEITEEMAKTHPERNKVTRSLGLETAVDVELNVVPLRDGDCILLCSDGLYDLVDEASIVRQLQKPPQVACEALIALANEAGGSDNISVIVAVVSWKEAEGSTLGHGDERHPMGDRRGDESTAEFDTTRGDDTSEHQILARVSPS